jgi:adenine-specific DNA-methyltransferase
MPTIQFKGKRAVWSYHLSVPFHTLDEDPSLSFQPEKAEGSDGRRNLIIEGDNLLALKALSPQYTGKIKCIYIDPPYNTGNENWVYNDNVNNPLFKTWLGKTVGKDDLTRHDKWLCMMTPRLQLMRNLLRDDGAIFISIDDNEQANLKMLMDEIFGEDNFVAELPVVMNLKGNNDQFGFAGTHEYAFVYSKNIEKITFGGFVVDDIELEEWEEDAYGIYKKGANLKSTGVNAPRSKRPNLFFPIFIDDNNNVYVTDDDRCPEILENKRYETILPITENEEMSWRWSKNKINDEKYNIIVNRNGELSIYKKQRPSLGELPSKKPKSLFYRPEYSSGNGTALLKELFGDKFFANPKPLQLIKDFIQLSTNKDDIILDAFAGSGTTLHAVMDLNNKDGGNRSCILIQAAEANTVELQKNICKNITRERNKRAIEKYNYNSGFTYLKVGIAIDAETMLSGQLPEYRQFAEYIYYLCTGKHLADKSDVSEETYFVAKYENAVIYLIYKKDFEALSKMALNITIAKDIISQHPNKKYIVYAPSCWLEDDFMKDNRIDFVGIPYNLFERVETR